MAGGDLVKSNVVATARLVMLKCGKLEKAMGEVVLPLRLTTVSPLETVIVMPTARPTALGTPGMRMESGVEKDRKRHVFAGAKWLQQAITSAWH